MRRAAREQVESLGALFVELDVTAEGAEDAGGYATDQGEAFYVGDQVAILGEGSLVQFGAPDDIYRSPNCASVAAFVGASNRVEGRLGQGGATFESPDLGVLALKSPVAGGKNGDPAVLMLRPESLGLRSADAGLPAARVIDRVLVGACDEYTVELKGGARWRARTDLRLARHDVDAAVGLAIAPDDVLVYAGTQ